MLKILCKPYFRAHSETMKRHIDNQTFLTCILFQINISFLASSAKAHYGRICLYECNCLPVRMIQRRKYESWKAESLKPLSSTHRKGCGPKSAFFILCAPSYQFRSSHPNPLSQVHCSALFGSANEPSSGTSCILPPLYLTDNINLLSYSKCPALTEPTI